MNGFPRKAATAISSGFAKPDSATGMDRA